MIKQKTAAELGLTEEDLAEQVKLSNEVLDEQIKEEKLGAAILQVDKLIANSEEVIKTLKAMRVTLLKELYPKMDWKKDQYDYQHAPIWNRFTALRAALKFKQATAAKVNRG